MIYDNLEKKAYIKQEFPLSISFIGGAKAEVSPKADSGYTVKFYNNTNNNLIYETFLKPGMWAKPSPIYFIEWRIEFWKEEELVYTHNYNCAGKRVYIYLNSKSIGDTLAWFPYIDEFRKKHNCEVVCSTFHNDWFKEEYPDLEFIKPGIPAHNLYASYGIGWEFGEDGNFNQDKSPSNFMENPLQQTASDILGIPYYEVKPKLAFKDQPNPFKIRYVVIGPHGTKHASYWNHKGGWQEIINYLNEKGYLVVMLSKEPLGDNWHDSKLGGKLHGVIDKTGDNSFEDVFNIIHHADAFIGIGSGLTWVSWALNKPTVLISGFSGYNSEMRDCIRITAKPSVCNNCFAKHKLDPGDWEWCPEYKDTHRHFECSKSITPDLVKSRIKHLLK